MAEPLFTIGIITTNGYQDIHNMGAYLQQRIQIWGEQHVQAIKNIVAEVLKKEVELILSEMKSNAKFVLKDEHTLRQLRLAGHPYRKGGTGVGHDPPETLHSQYCGGSGQSGKGEHTIFDSMKAQHENPADGTYAFSRIVFTNEDDAKIYQMLVHGTERMMPRPLGMAILTQRGYKIRENVKIHIRRYFEGLKEGS